MAFSAGSVASSDNKQGGGGLQLLANITNTSASAKGYALPWQKGRSKELTKLKAPRGVYSEKTSPAESPPVIKSPPPVLRERPKHTQPSPPNELVKLHQIVKKVHILYKKACTHYRHILKGTQIFLLHKKAVGLQMFGACISSGMGILSPAKWLELILASMIRLYGSRQNEIYVDFFGFPISLEDVTDDIKS